MLGYIDPGSGSVILQMVAGGVVGALFAVKCCWQRIRRLVILLWSRNRMTVKHKINAER